MQRRILNTIHDENTLQRDLTCNATAILRFLRPVKRKKFETFKHICLIKWPIYNKTFEWSGMYRVQNCGTAGSLTSREYKHEILFILHFLQNGLSKNVDFW